MNFIFYDLETTGRSLQWDQILQVAAVLTDSNLNVLDTFNETCKIRSYCLPDPEALLVNKLPIKSLLKSNYSLYQLIFNIFNKFNSWSPAIYIGYNSIQYDEEMLRSAFFTNLFDPYLTIKGENSRVDLLNIVRAANYFYPEKVKSQISSKGNPILKLDQIAPLNGITDFIAHDALGDTKATVLLAKLIKEKIPSLWYNNTVRQKKENILYKIENNLFCSLESFFGRTKFFVLSYIGQHPLYKWALCFDLKNDPRKLEKMTDEELYLFLEESPKKIRNIKSNKSPIILDQGYIDKIPDYQHLDKEILAKRHIFIKKNIPLQKRILKYYYQKNEYGFNETSQLDIFSEETIYKKFLSKYDLGLMKEFHSGDWVDKNKIKNRFRDKRLKYFANLMLYEEQPNVLDQTTLNLINKQIAERLLSKNKEKWLTIFDAYKKIDDLREKHKDNSNNISMLEDINKYIESVEKKLQKYII